MVAIAPHKPVDLAVCGDDGAFDIPDDLTPLEHELLQDLFAIVSEHADEVAAPVDRKQVLLDPREIRRDRRAGARVRRGVVDRRVRGDRDGALRCAAGDRRLIAVV